MKQVNEAAVLRAFFDLLIHLFTSLSLSALYCILATLGISYWQTKSEKASEEKQYFHSVFLEFCVTSLLDENL